MFLLLLALVISLVILYWHFNRDYYVLAMCRRIKSMDDIELSKKVMEIPQKTIFGHNFDLFNTNGVSLFKFLRNNVQLAKGKGYLLYFLRSAVYNIVNAEDAEAVLQSTELIKKGVIYDMVVPFLGDGLLISTDQKWHFRRKILTPAFHFNILQSFLEVFKEETHKLLDIFEEKGEEPFALLDVIPQFTLNSVCETALGVKLDNIAGSIDYRDAIHKFEEIAVARSCRPLMYFKIYFYLFGEFKKHADALEVTHTFASDLIGKRREEFQKTYGNGDFEGTQLTDEYGKKKRYAMLDTLLYNERKGLIDHQGICDEVNTFMFEGYDTTSTCLIFTLFSLATYPEIQEACYQEIKTLGNLNTLTVFDYNRLEYLECVLKETLRLYPSVPFISRQCVKDTVINGLFLPKNSQINIHIFDIMRDPRHFPEPTKFQPERFQHDNTTNRHPFAFVPFSAGPRNCIGQKFALLEIKVLLVEILRNFILKPVTRLEDIIYENGMVLRTQTLIQVKLEKREKQ